MTKPLSPAAAAVWKAFEHADCDPYLVDPRKAGLAAALRAAADQVVPGIGREVDCLDEPVEAELQNVRSYLLDIAAELSPTETTHA